MFALGCGSNQPEVSCEPLTITLDGKPLELAHRIAYRQNGDWRVVLAASPMTCDQLRDHELPRPRLEVVAVAGYGGVSYELDDYEIGMSIDPGPPTKCKAGQPCSEIHTKLTHAPKAAGESLAMCIDAVVPRARPTDPRARRSDVLR